MLGVDGGLWRCVLPRWGFFDQPPSSWSRIVHLGERQMACDDPCVRWLTADHLVSSAGNPRDFSAAHCHFLGELMHAEEY